MFSRLTGRQTASNKFHFFYEIMRIDREENFNLLACAD